ncbi:fasciclin domain-containing protein [Noviherbaspirillum saxi]|uniref:Fasciclin domain-containing protein n=1 Tax=Noviherbaspirillum saxi TaxID=2320863 RepID=A0A3A3FS06_9BURK|nr:fasciclin domain-containing protein [Noviherbaspirillum saxi]RJF98836.1 fasciclin domain-containing protein [Noviherbaspirillum saxi]
MKRIFAAFASAIGALLVILPASAADIIETASTTPTFKTFVSAAKAAGVADTLKNSGPYTVFAPTDSAFDKLPPGTMSELMKDKAKLAELLTHHVVPGKIAVAEVKPGKVKTVQGQEVTLKNDNGKVTFDNANVIQSDVMADNGVIHEIDTVILPQK